MTTSVVAAFVLPPVAIATSMLARRHIAGAGLHPVVGAVVTGLAFAAVSYAVMTRQNMRAAASKAALLGFVVAQGTLIPRAKTVMGAIAFVLLVTMLTINLRNVEQ